MVRADLTGQKFSKYTFIRFDSMRRTDCYWLCRCDCGNEKVVRAQSVQSGVTTSCGCGKHEDLTGQTFHYLIAIEYNIELCKWLCECICGNCTYVRAYGLTSGGTKSCGCYNQEMRLARKGKNNPNWRHDLTKEEREDNKNRQYCPKNNKWRKKVFERDNHTCQCCGQIGGNLEAHHIYSYHSHKKLRYVTSNGVTLCKSCHKRFHKEFGQKNNTQKQLTKFMKPRESLALLSAMA